MRIVASRTIGEFRHLQRTEADRARVPQAPQGSRSGGRDKVAADQRTASHDIASVVIHVLVCQRYAMQRPTVAARSKRSVGLIRRLQRSFGLDRHEGVDMRLPARDPLQARARHLTRRQAPLGDRFGDRSQRHQRGFAAHGETFISCTSRKLAGSRSNGMVPATAAKPSKAGPIELAIRSATSASTPTPAMPAIAATSLGLGFVMRLRSLKWRVAMLALADCAVPAGLLRQQLIGSVPVGWRRILLIVPDSRLIEIVEQPERPSDITLAAALDCSQRAIPIAVAVARQHILDEVPQSLKALRLRNIFAAYEGINHLGLLLALHHDEVDFEDREVVLDRLRGGGADDDRKTVFLGLSLQAGRKIDGVAECRIVEARVR